jgi:hypothetical protein
LVRGERIGGSPFLFAGLGESIENHIYDLLGFTALIRRAIKPIPQSQIGLRSADFAAWQRVFALLC